MTQVPTFKHEHKLWGEGCKYVAGVDEVGRGAFAGPVVAAAVVLPKNFPIDAGINDSKLLSPKERERLCTFIKENSLSYSVATVSVTVINRIGIGKATQKAFQKAIWHLSVPPDRILIDAFYIKAMGEFCQTPIVKGDQISISIAAASIIAKVHRDRLMCRYDDADGRYGFAVHKGYGTKLHQERIREFGLSKLHRLSFNLNKFI